MKLHLIQSLLPALVLCTTSAAADYSGETFEEELILRPERDGRVVAGFSFKTLLDGAFPRNPETLGLEDQCRPGFTAANGTYTIVR